MRVCKRGAGELGGESYEEVRYEGYGTGGIAVLVEAETDNINRTVSEVRHAFSKHGGNLGTSGSVAYMFNNIGILSYTPGADEDAIMEAALEAGAEDVITDDEGGLEVLTTPEMFGEVQNALVAAGFTPDEAEVTMRADNLTPLDAEAAEKLLKMVDTLEELDDVQAVYTNADIADEVMEALG
ncbi:MAG: YebC/PmpR family DNA-binding transcriptional regulator [Gammaproteobacteria bacterium]|nr:MAG: YebC/PmpR family DNA-binding transcriptional regulator [Gammaproteobacteria bacterium]